MARTVGTRFYAALFISFLCGGIGLSAMTRHGPYQERQLTDSLTAAPTWSIGDNKGLPVVAELSDFQCPTCRKVASVTDSALLAWANAGKISLRFYDFPLPQHMHAVSAAGAAYCAAAQGAYVHMRDSLYATQPAWAEMDSAGGMNVFARFASAVVPNVPRWRQCMNTHSYEAHVDSEVAMALGAGLDATPTFVLGSKAISGNLSLKMVSESVAQFVALQGKAK